MRAAMLNPPVRIRANSPLSDTGICGIGAARHSRPKRRTCHVHARMGRDNHGGCNGGHTKTS